MKASSALKEAFRKMASVENEHELLNAAAMAACRMSRVEYAGVYAGGTEAGELVLSAWCGLPGWFTSAARTIREGVAEVPVLNGDPPVHASGTFPLFAGTDDGPFMFTASSRQARLFGTVAAHLEWLALAAGAHLLRLEGSSALGRALEGRDLLLDRILDPAALLDGGFRILHCNRAFRELTGFDGSEKDPIPFREAAGRELHGLLKEILERVLVSGEPASDAVTFGESTFSTAVHPGPGILTVVLRDVTAEEDAGRRLGFREKLEGLLISIATDFIEMQGSALNLGINDALLNIGVAIEADRAFLFTFSSDLEDMSNTHEWCASNIQPYMDRLQGLRTSRYPWWMNRLAMRETILVPRLSDMPEWAEAERELLEGKDVQSIVAVPIVHGRDLIGFLGFEYVNRETAWSDEVIDLLRMVGDAMGNALQRNRMEKEMLRMYRKAEKEAQINAVLLREVNHRVKNNLSEIIGLLYAQRRFSNGDYSDFITNLTGRIRGLATVHDMLSRTGWKPLELTRLARGIVGGAIGNAPEGKELRTSVSSSSVTVDPNRAHALALILNELVRNSMKHALRHIDRLLIKVRMRKDRNGRVTLTYSDDGPGYPEQVVSTERGNLGLDLIRNLVTKNLQGDLTLLNDGGAAARIVFSIRPPEEETIDEEE
ncbi:MAG: hypothetical protein AVO35_03465 [Candidatus Aegiribacteria sp. MLS_C]|nr:MAG: hypothetical protein AVO35_03465 [Candidatus Aegiribacteria sp. MLS_C]